MSGKKEEDGESRFFDWSTAICSSFQPVVASSQLPYSVQRRERLTGRFSGREDSSPSDNLSTSMTSCDDGRDLRLRHSANQYM